MKAFPLDIPDVLLIEPTVFGDERGFFFESYNKKVFDNLVGREVDFVQDNHSKSQRGVLRGMHYQVSPNAQGKLVRVIQGEVFDVAVDMRRDSPTLGSWIGVHLSAENRRQLWIPEGFAHGFLTLSETAEFLYKTTNYYSPESEGGFSWDDPLVNVDWPLVGLPLLSEKDTKLPGFTDVTENG